MAAGRVRLNRAGVRALLSSRQVAAMLRRRAQKVLDRAVATAPVDTGAYRDSLLVEVDVGGSRVRARVGSTVEYAALIQARTGHLARALDAAGTGTRDRRRRRRGRGRRGR